MNKKQALSSLMAACVLAVPALAQSRTVTLSTQLKKYGGDGAYLAIYLTDAKGAYAGTLWDTDGTANITFTWTPLATGTVYEPASYHLQVARNAALRSAGPTA